jgi:predicted transcriptional regulator
MTSKKKNRIEEPTETYDVTPTNEVTSEELHPVLIQLIEKGLKEIEEGKTFTNEEVMRMTKEKFKKHL